MSENPSGFELSNLEAIKSSAGSTFGDNFLRMTFLRDPIAHPECANDLVMHLSFMIGHCSSPKQVADILRKYADELDRTHNKGVIDTVMSLGKIQDDPK